LPTRRVGCCTSPARTSTAATGSPSHAPEPTGVRARVSAGVPPRLRPPVLYLWLASSSGRPVRQSAQAVSSVSRRSRRPTHPSQASGSPAPRRRSNGCRRTGAHTAHMHRPHAPPTVHPAVPLPPNACLTGRPSVSGGVGDGHHPWSVAASSIARWWASRTAGRCTGASVMWGASPSAAPLAPPAASRPASRCHPRRCGATPGSTPGRSLTKVSNASHLN
jgi:hypothetical protein